MAILHGVLGRLALAFGSIGLIFVLGECMARILWEDPTIKPPPPVPAEWRDLPRLESLFEMAKPNIRGLTAGVLYETNSKAFRGPERTEAKPAGVYRILIGGDSVAMGWGTLYDDTYAARLERTLPRALTDRTYEVINVALSGLNTQWVLWRLERIGLRYDPDLIVYGYTLNDIEGDKYRRSRAAPYIDLVGSSRSPVYLWRFLGPRFLSLSELVWTPVGSYVYELEDNYFRNPEAWAEVLKGLDQFATLAKARDVCGVLFLHARLDSLNFLHPYHAIYKIVADAASERGLHVIHSFDHVRGQSATDLWVNLVDPHPNAEGHRMYAAALVDGLGSLPEQCWHNDSVRAVRAH